MLAASLFSVFSVAKRSNSLPALENRICLTYRVPFEGVSRVLATDSVLVSKKSPEIRKSPNLRLISKLENHCLFRKIPRKQSKQMSRNQVQFQRMHPPLQNAYRIVENGCVVAESLAIKVVHLFIDLAKISGARNQIWLGILITLNGRISELRWILKEFLGALINSTSRVIDLSLFWVI